MRHYNNIQNSFSSSKTNVLLYRRCLYRNWHLCTEVDCTHILYVPKVTVTILKMYRNWLYRKKTCTESVCTETVMYRNRRTPVRIILTNMET